MKIFRFVKIPIKVLNDLVLFFITWFPGQTGRKMRYIYWSRRLKSCGKNVIIDEGVIIQNPEYISIGNNVWIDKFCVLIAGKSDLRDKKVKYRENKNFSLSEGEMFIDDNVHIAPFCILQSIAGIYIGKNSGLASGVKIYSLSNLPTDPKNLSEIVYFTPLNQNTSYLHGPVVLQENVGVALNSVILPGITIYKNSFIEPNSVVISNIPENSHASGFPAKKIKDRFKIE